MQRSLFLVMLALLPYFSQGQNLIPNPEFDTYSTCPNSKGQILYAPPWFSPNYNTVDFAHLCAGQGLAGIPINRWGDQHPVLGNGYAGIRTYFQSDDGVWDNYREYLSVQLSQPLDSGQWYYVSFQTSAGESAKYYSDDLGLALTDTVEQEDVLDYSQAISNPQGRMLNNYTNWQTITGTYQAKGGERYATIGNFLPDSLTTIFEEGVWDSLFSSTYYFIDEVIVSPCDFKAGDQFIVAQNDTFCQGEQVQLSLNPQLNLTSISWYNASSSPTIMIQNEGWYWVELTDSKGCKLQDSIYLHTSMPPEFSLGPDTVICPNDGWLLSVPPEENLQYRWENGDSNHFRYIDAPGKYLLRVASAYCEQSDEIAISYPETPISDFGFDTLICEGASLLLGYDFPAATYFWQDGSAERSYSVSLPGTYRLNLQTQCYMVEDVFVVEMQDCDCTERIPNFFSPNADGINDLWWIDFSPGVENVHWGIIDRWGRPLFDSQDPGTRWDGIYQGRPLAEGVYFWWVNYRCWDGQALVASHSSGSLSLFR